METRLIMLPGLAADERLLSEQRAAFPVNSVVPEWLAPSGQESLERYGDRFASHLAAKGLLRERFAFVGFSFGGQVALEVSRSLLRLGEVLPQAIVLISACRTRDAVTAEFRRQVRVGTLLPAGLVRAVAVSASGAFAKRALADSPQWVEQLRAMARDLDVPMLKWGGRATVSWGWTRDHERELRDAGVRIHQIHGARDVIIPPFEGDPDEIIEGAGHLIQWTHAERVNDAIRRTCGC